MAYGGPDSLNDVPAYLDHVRGGRPSSAELVEEMRERYRLIGGKSPLKEITLRVASLLEEMLNTDEPGRWRVYTGMRHWHPFIHETAPVILGDELDELIAVCMTPFDSPQSSRLYFSRLRQAITGQDHPVTGRQPAKIIEIPAWYDNRQYVDLWADLVRAAMNRTPEETTVLFSAHSLPAPADPNADPYDRQYRLLAQMVAHKAGLQPGGWQVVYQCAKGGPQPWLGPALPEVMRRLAAEGVSSVMVSPLGFVCDHVETLYDLDVEAADLAAELGLRWQRVESLNDRPEFIQALAQVVREAHQTE